MACLEVFASNLKGGLFSLSAGVNKLCLQCPLFIGILSGAMLSRACFYTKSNELHHYVMTLSFGPDEMRNIMLSILDVTLLMEALFVCQLLVNHVMADDRIILH